MWVPLIRMCCLSGSTWVSWWRCCVGEVCVQPVAINGSYKTNPIKLMVPIKIYHDEREFDYRRWN